MQDLDDQRSNQFYYSGPFGFFVASAISSFIQIVIYILLLVVIDLLLPSDSAIFIVSVVSILAYVYAVAQIVYLVNSLDDETMSGFKPTVWNIINAFITNVVGSTSVSLLVWLMDPDPARNSSWIGINGANIYMTGLRIFYQTSGMIISAGGQYKADNDMAVLWSSYVSVYGAIANILIISYGIQNLGSRKKRHKKVFVDENNEEVICTTPNGTIRRITPLHRSSKV